MPLSVPTDPSGAEFFPSPFSSVTGSLVALFLSRTFTALDRLGENSGASENGRFFDTRVIFGSLPF